MRQKADKGLPHLGQKTPNAPGKTLSEINVAQMAFSLNQSSVLCLPLVSDSQRLVWVSSNEINLQLDGAAMLSEAFDRFPYLTQKQTAALAQRCSLHLDQVRVWFMAQRLRYGISWDYKDIPNVRTKMSGQGKEEPQNRKGPKVREDGGENKKRKRKKKEPGGKKAGEVREEQGASEGRMTGEKVRAAEKLEIEMKPEQPMKKDKGIKEEKDKRNPQKKRKKMTVTDRVGKKRVKQEEGVTEKAEGVEIRSEEAEKEMAQFNRQKKKSQLAMMKAAFSNCQYPDVKDYDRLAMLIDIPRYMLVQWFGDMRYYIKKFRPRWLTEEQYSQALANIRYRQYLTELVKMQPQVAGSAGDGEATWKIKLDGSEISEEEESVPAPPEEKLFHNL